MMFSVYILICPLTDKVRYVGVSNNLKQRYAAHTQSPSKYIKPWIQSLKQDGALPLMKEIERIDVKCSKGAMAFQVLGDSKLTSRELFWIDHYSKQGCDLLNKRGVISLNAKKNTNIIYLPEQLTETE